MRECLRSRRSRGKLPLPVLILEVVVHALQAVDRDGRLVSEHLEDLELLLGDGAGSHTAIDTDHSHEGVADHEGGKRKGICGLII